MIIFLIISIAFVIGTHKLLMSAVDNHNYGYGSYEEWREFEKQFEYEDALKF